MKKTESKNANRINLAIFASGQGSNFSAIVKSLKNNKKLGSIVLVCDQPQAYVIRRAGRSRIKVILVSRQDFRTRNDFESAIISRLQAHRINLIALAGFMRILSPAFVKRFHQKIINIHPSLLPAFKGAQAIKDAFKHKASVTGVTVHFVDRQVDHGAVILQETVKIRKQETLTSLEKRIHAVEHQLYPRVIQLFLDGRIILRGNRVRLG